MALALSSTAFCEVAEGDTRGAAGDGASTGLLSTMVFIVEALFGGDEDPAAGRRGSDALGKVYCRVGGGVAGRGSSAVFMIASDGGADAFDSGADA